MKNERCASPFFIYLIVMLLLGVFSAECEEAEDLTKKHTLLFFLDNDIVGGTDQHYTNAVRLTWLFPEVKTYSDYRFMPNWLKKTAEKLFYGNNAEFFHNVSISIGQHIYTPEDIYKKELIKEDRPYAGCTYLSFALHNKSFSIMNTYSVVFGMVGSSSFADKTQRFVHKVINDAIPKGWDNQIKDEPVLQLTYEQKWRLLHRMGKSGVGFDCLPSFEIIAGNVAVASSVSCEFRMGYHLPSDFGTSFNRPASGVTAPPKPDDSSQKSRHEFGIYISTGAACYGIAREIFLDGNTFKDSHSVKKKPVIIETGAGITFYYKNAKITYTQVYRTKEFDRQKEQAQSYGSVNLAFSF